MVKMKNIITYIFVLILISCQKKDKDPPELLVNNPLAMTNYSVLDHISIEGNVSDERNIEWIQIQLLNSNLNSVAEEIVINTNELNYNFSESIHINDIHLSTGKYYIKVSVSDGDNEVSQFVEVNISEIPLELKDTYVLTTSNQNFDLYRINGNTTVFHQSFNGNFQSGVSNSYHQHLFLAGDQGGFGFDPTYQYNLWTIADQPGNYNYFLRGIYSNDDQLNYISHGNGTIKGYNKYGNVVYSALMGSNEVPEDVLVHNNLIYAEVFSSLLNRDLVVFFKGSGMENKRLSIDQDIISLIPRNEDEIYLFANENNQGYFDVYYTNTNLKSALHSIPTGLIYDAIAISSDLLLIAHESGLLRYTYSNNSLVNVVPGEQFSKLRYDDFNGVVLAAIGNQLRYYSSLGDPLGVVTHSDNIDDFYLYYNK